PYAAPAVLGAVALVRTEDLKESGVRSRSVLPTSDGREVATLHRGRRLHAAEREQSRREVNLREARVGLLSRFHAARITEDSGDADRFLPGLPLQAQPVRAEHVAVIG